MKRKLKYIKRVFEVCLILSILTLSNNVNAEKLTEAQVRNAVQTWVRLVTADAKPNAIVESMEPYTVNGEVFAYVAHLRNDGFCICGADDLVLPVYIYNPKADFNNSWSVYEYFFSEIYARTMSLRTGIRENDPKLRDIREILSERFLFWKDLINGNVPLRIKNLKYQPALDSLNFSAKWRQSAPYNANCPVLTPPNERVLVGCGAIALSQILYHWQWPSTGEGTGSTVYYYRNRTNWDKEYLDDDPGIPDDDWDDRLKYEDDSLRMNGYWDETLYEEAQEIDTSSLYKAALTALYNRLTSATTTCSVNFGNTNYDWSEILDEHTGSTPTQGNDEVAKICFHAGVSVGMDYGIKGSGSSYNNIAPAFEDHWQYDTDAVLNDRDTSIMTEELRWLRPVFFRGRTDSDASKGSGHFWNVYGYNTGTDPDRQYLMNMGWGPGQSHVWHTIDNITYTSGNFKYHQKHVTYVAPKDIVKFIGNTSSGDGSPDNPYNDIEAAIADTANIPDAATLIFKTGSENTFSAESIILDFPVTLKGRDVIIKKE
ncbi:MAG: C10 family peptidase [Bacteroidetes bacterium]|nr:C10 family peptidase [Bacteroidota bacterium]MBL7103009.1 C10 family peptidase [Bacteroidales bacterium]